MDYLLKCYLDQFSTSPRNTLHDRRKRRSVVEYISTLIEGCIRGQNCDPETIVRDAIIAIIRYHEENRASNGYVCMMGKFHNILYVAVKLCYDWQLKDTGTVIALLEHIYSCEGTFERIFIGAIFGNTAPYYIAGWKSDFESQEENLRAVVYFIDHATNGGLEVSYENGNFIRFIDAPIETCGKASPVKIAIQLGLPDKLLIFLRYGASINDNSVEILLKRLMEFCHVYPYNIIACLQLVLRAIPTIELTREVIFENYFDLVKDSIIPLTRCGIEVPELKHITRCCIRKRLGENHQLPHGIRVLSIPDSLKRYIDIMED
ncbi:SOCS box domain containing protein [Asbolus verrucosus]|uniref:SOCS box domain containing protein n=1 Tax=Asbolus verrucosus TaxID=1661398 RepID=A0A482V7J1_ASBVE|nr:SOCS box domain containing protein [Asbolus verrucosus]